MKKCIVICVTICCLIVQTIVAQTYKPKITDEVVAALNFSVNQYKLMIASLPDSTKYPRKTVSSSNFTLVTVGAGDWTSGFFPGCLWYLYEYTGDNFWKKNALRWTGNLYSQQINLNQGHDVGFVMNCSYGNALRLTGNEYNKPVLIQSGKTLSNLFSDKVGCTKSWNSGSWSAISTNVGAWKFPVIIDNMMNLELLIKTTQLSNDSLYFKRAVKHAITTALNHQRPDSSTYHVVDYDDVTGAVRGRGTRQGLADYSCWSRGQAWGIYGFTMMYKYTQMPEFLANTKKLLGYYHKRIPSDFIPFWDYNDALIPNTYKDASAGSIMASALIDLYQMTTDSTYLITAEKILQSLSSSAYTNALGTKANFILLHSTGGINYETDVPEIYSEYYYIEALIKYLRLDPTYQFSNHSPEFNTSKIDPATKGLNYSFQLQVFDFDKDNIEVSSSNLPQGLTVNSSGLISGIPEVSGIFNVAFKVSDTKSETVSNLKLTVNNISGVNENFNSDLINVVSGRTAGRTIIRVSDTMTSENMSLKIFSASGQLVFSTKVGLNQHSIEVPFLEKGIFIIHLFNNNQLIASEKIVL